MNQYLKSYLILGLLLIGLVIGSIVMANTLGTQTSSRTVTPPSVVLKMDSAQVVQGKYLVGVFAKSSKQGAEIFGINLRFFYDATDFSQGLLLKNFKGGYGVQTAQPVPVTGNAASKNMLGFDGAFRYVNGLVQLNNLDLTPVLLDTAKWTRLFDVEFSKLQTDVSCAPIVWEKMPNWQDGGFLGGSEGLVVTILADQPSAYQTTRTAATGINSNWNFKLPIVRGKYPYGIISCPPVAPTN